MAKKKNSWLAAPFGVWMAFFTLIPLGVVVYFALTDSAGAFTFDNLLGIGQHAGTLLRSIWLGAIATVLCLILGYPVAYSISRAKGVSQQTMVMLIMLPQWMNFLLRTYAWMTLLENNGLINKFLGLIGIGPLSMINTSGAVVLGMVYNFLPFMILPLYSVMTKIDKHTIEAAQDLGANGLNVFRRVILPLSVPGIITGITMVFVPAVSTFVISKLLGGGKDMLIGDLIEMLFAGTAVNYNVGSALSLVLMILIVVCMAVMNKFDDGEETGALIA
ncbi:MAG: ABC transporter permease [Oscillospiraceae bacterium]|jgi:spermidine/putrescine transport system permease protein|nr:ABC transporter permease [Oscillospiraceae bacterium]